MKDLLAVIVNHNGEYYIDKTIKAFFNTFKKEGDLFIVDSGSTDKSRDIILNLAVDFSFSYLFNSNLGYAKSANSVLKVENLKDFKYILVMNGDVILQGNWFEVMSNVMDNDSSIFVTGPKQVDAGGLIVAAGIVGDERHCSIRSWKVKNMPELHDKVEEVVMVCGSMLLFNSANLQKVGLFSDCFFHYYEETDLQYRAHKFGFKNVYVPLNPPVLHLHMGSCKDVSKLTKYFCDSKIQFNKIWGFVPNGG